ncbi:bifunctional 2-polyprenyl-6-hydroxyphenol methylase/3-demethylubiquinol 3-O-methyltransferase UbiG [Cellulomonas sp. URHD0024]|uniref:class I SAM-dependent methyltransferase n=1 Tax=Cellulomonas sp. URHD0024 TaxID=1302620 RepID=UPI0004062642|nr:class I SAM-dependent methyltransferase [Cellulomonas sp. URHD0024]
MPTYDVAVDESADNNSHALIVQFVGHDKRVLDVGCATGYLGEVLRRRGCVVTGIERDPAALAAAEKVLDEVVAADLETVVLADHFAPESFDVIIFGDVLEHLTDPERLLRAATALLAPRGYVVISVPNVTHGSVRLALLQGRWRYTDRGLLDTTHVRFFTRTSLTTLVRSSGLVEVDVVPTTADALDVEVDVDATALPEGVLDWVREQPDADTYQFVVRAVRADADGALERAQGAAAEASRRAASLEHEVAGLAANVGSLERALEHERARRDDAEAELRAVYGTRSMRLLARPRGWWAAARRR